MDEKEIWDEFRWEEFMREQDRKVERCMDLIFRAHSIARAIGWGWMPGPVWGAAPDREDEELDEGEEWKASVGFGENEPFCVGDCAGIPVYLLAQSFALRALRLVDSLPEHARLASAVVDFVSSAMIAPAKIAGGTSIGDDLEELGGNIAYCKRGLAAANCSIAALREMRQRRIVEGEVFFDLTREAAEVRNAIALHILDLREKFRGGY
ncbi:MAG TPA: hypothetical protein VES59_08940 [Bacteroidota bacterium]|nr:hypothetical protein [Bacteroidota bacterium]